MTKMMLLLMTMLVVVVVVVAVAVKVFKSLASREMQIKPTLKLSLAPVRRAIIKTVNDKEWLVFALALSILVCTAQIQQSDRSPFSCFLYFAENWVEKLVMFLNHNLFPLNNTGPRKVTR